MTSAEERAFLHKYMRAITELVAARTGFPCSTRLRITGAARRDGTGSATATSRSG